MTSSLLTSTAHCTKWPWPMVFIWLKTQGWLAFLSFSSKIPTVTPSYHKTAVRRAHLRNTRKAITETPTCPLQPMRRNHALEQWEAIR